METGNWTRQETGNWTRQETGNWTRHHKANVNSLYTEAEVLLTRFFHKQMDTQVDK